MKTMTLVEQSQGRIRAVSLDGVTPAAANVERGTYVGQDRAGERLRRQR